MIVKQMLCVICGLLLFCSSANAQKAESFDVLTYIVPKGWQKDVGRSAVQLGVDGAKGACVIMLFKSLPGSDNSRDNFNAAWDTIVKDTAEVTSKPDTQPATKQNGWTIESGSTQYESNGKKGFVRLVTMTGKARFVSILVLSDTESYQAEVASFIKSITLPKLEGNASPPNSPTTEKPAATPTPRKSNFKFDTTNFDDGWTAVEQDNWVRVTKGNIAVLVHYPNQKADAYNSVLKAGLQNAWDILVTPRYANIRNLELKPIQSFESIAFAEADAEDKATGKNVHVVLFKKHFSKGNGKYIEFVTSSKSAFEQEFGAYHNDEFGWDKLVNMQGKNRFAVGSQDLTGKWSTSDYASLAYYYVNTGGYAGATATSTADLFSFSPSGTYQSDHSGASGVVGNQKFSRQVYKGAYSTNSWTLTLTNRFKGESEKYDCYFEAIKGGRILMLTDKRNTVLPLVKQQ